MKYLLWSIASIILTISCSTKHKLAPNANTKIIAKTYHLNIKDSSNVLVKHDSVYTVFTPNDSFLAYVDTIFYTEPNKKLRNIKQLKSCNLVKSYSNNKLLKEYYNQSDKGFYLLGYSLGDSLSKFEFYEKPLVILPKTNNKVDSIETKKLVWNLTNQSFEPDTKISTKVSLAKNGFLNIEHKAKPFLQYNLTLKADAKMAYGEQGLIIPDAIIIKSNLLYINNNGLILEWSEKVENSTFNVSNNKEIIEEPLRYLELTYYKQSN